jgi:hypothetical protein
MAAASRECHNICLGLDVRNQGARDVVAMAVLARMYAWPGNTRLDHNKQKMSALQTVG